MASPVDLPGSAEHRLRSFEAKVASIYNEGKIRAPVHLSDGSEKELIKIFQRVDREDFVLSTWRSHYHALLHGIPEEKLESSIRAGYSIALSFPEYNFFSSAIVGGMLSIGVGIAEGLKRRESKSKVWVFLGDMAANTGIAFSSVRYANARELPINFVIEDNGLSVCTPTKEVWPQGYEDLLKVGGDRVFSFRYTSKYPHAGAGKRIEF